MPHPKNACDMYECPSNYLKKKTNPWVQSNKLTYLTQVKNHIHGEFLL